MIPAKELQSYLFRIFGEEIVALAFEDDVRGWAVLPLVAFIEIMDNFSSKNSYEQTFFVVSASVQAELATRPQLKLV